MFDASWVDTAVQTIRARADWASIGLVAAEVLALVFVSASAGVVFYFCRHAQPERRPYGC